MVGFVLVVVGVLWFFAAMVGMWVSMDAPEYSRKQAIAQAAYMSFLCMLCLVGLAIGVGIFISAPR